MVDEQQPAKKVVKRVVKKTVVRPLPPTQPQPTMRYGRPVTGTTATKPRAKTRTGTTHPSTPRPAVARPRVDVGAKVGAAGRAIGTRGSSAASGVAGVAGSASRTAGSFVADRFHRAIVWRVPHIDLRLASLISGLVAGLVSGGLALAALALFTEVRGVASGGGRWGALTFVAVSVVAFVVGERLLTAFGSSMARLTSLLGVILTIVAILGLFLGLADSRWGLVIVPVLAAICYAIAHWLLSLAENTPPELD